MDGKTLLYKAAVNGDTTVLKLLFDAGADPNKANIDGSIPLEMAKSKRYRKDVAKLLIDAGATP